MNLIRQNWKQKALHQAWLCVLVSALYIIAAWLCLNFCPHEYIATVWLPSGVAVVAFTVYGRCSLPGIFLGCFATNTYALTLLGKADIPGLLPLIGMTLLGVVQAGICGHAFREQLQSESDTITRNNLARIILICGAACAMTATAAAAVSAIYLDGSNFKLNILNIVISILGNFWGVFLGLILVCTVLFKVKTTRWWSAHATLYLAIVALAPIIGMVSPAAVIRTAGPMVVFLALFLVVPRIKKAVLGPLSIVSAMIVMSSLTGADSPALTKSFISVIGILLTLYTTLYVLRDAGILKMPRIRCDLPVQFTIQSMSGVALACLLLGAISAWRDERHLSDTRDKEFRNIRARLDAKRAELTASVYFLQELLFMFPRKLHEESNNRIIAQAIEMAQGRWLKYGATLEFYGMSELIPPVSETLATTLFSRKTTIINSEAFELRDHMWIYKSTAGRENYTTEIRVQIKPSRFCDAALEDFKTQVSVKVIDNKTGRNVHESDVNRRYPTHFAGVYRDFIFWGNEHTIRVVWPDVKTPWSFLRRPTTWWFIGGFAGNYIILLMWIQRVRIAEVGVKLKQALKVRERFVASVSHELRTPLGGVINSAELLQENIFGSLTSDQERRVKRILSCANHLEALIGNILDITRIDSGKLQLVYEPCGVHGFAEEVTENIEHLARQKRISVEFDFEYPDVLIMADRSRLLQVLVNLMTNAIRFTPEGGRCGIKQRANDDMVEIDVWDTGIGIDVCEQELIFDRFFQVDQSLSRSTSGVGIGLNLVKELIALMHGRIEVVSEIGKGSHFILRLPRVLTV